MATPTEELPRIEEQTSAVPAILSDLPCSDAFSLFEPTISNTDFKRYIPDASDSARQIRISNEKSRCLIRALTARCHRQRKRSAPSTVTQPAPKRPRWLDLEKEKKQHCLKVALSASCKHGEPGDALDLLKRGWAQNPRRKQPVTAEVRRLIRERIPLWSERELRSYLSKAGEASNEMSVQQMRTIIREHLYS